MKKSVSFAMMMFFFLPVCLIRLQAQVTIGSLSIPNRNAVLDLRSNDSLGFLLPRLELTRTDLPNPLKAHVPGMVVYNMATTGDVIPGFYYDEGNKWIWLGTAWNLKGNAGTDATGNFLGTTDDNDLVFKRNNIQAGRLSANNTAFGVGALPATATGTGNVAVGNNSLSATQTGSNNIAIGTSALGANTSGTSQIAIGHQALALSAASSNSNIAIGQQALYSNTTGGINIAIGYQALYNNNTPTGNGYAGLRNIAIGYTALYNNALGIGTAAGGYDNIAVGYNALRFSTLGYQNTAFGNSALYNNTGGRENTAIGHRSQEANTIGNLNMAVGAVTLAKNTLASNNVAMGTYSLSNYLGTTDTGTAGNGQNTAVGAASGQLFQRGDYNTLIGAYALSMDTVGSENVAIGANTAATYKHSGKGNTLIGTKAGAILGGYYNGYAEYNICIGYQAGNKLTTGSDNMIIGNTVYTPSDSILGNHNILIGSNLTTTYTNANYQLNIGNTVFGTRVDSVTSTFAAGRIGINTPAPNSTLEVAGSVTMPIVNTTNRAYTLGEKDYTLILTGTGGISVTLPNPTTCKGRMYRIVNACPDQGTITFSLPIYIIGGSPPQTSNELKADTMSGGSAVNGSFSHTVLIQSDGANWWRISL